MFDISVGGFWRSFIALPICTALQMATLALPAAGLGDQRNLATFAVNAGATIVTLLVVLAGMLFMAKLIKRDARFSVFVILYNWCSVVMFCASLAMVALESVVAGGPLQGAPNLLAFIYVQVYTWFILRESLLVDMLIAFLLMIFITAVQLLANYGIGEAIHYLTA